MREYTNTSCPFYGSKYCDVLHMESCESCTIGASDNPERVRAELDVTMSLMPEQGVHGLFDTEECVLCKGKPGKRAWYADMDIANAQPKHEQRNIIGMKSVARTGSLVPLQIACCEDCRKRILLIEYLPTCMSVGVCLLTLLLLSIRPLREAMMRTSMIVPFLLFVGIAAAAYFIGSALRKRLIANAESKTYLHVFDLPAMAGMKERGWFELSEGKGITRYIFSKKLMKRGLYTGAPQSREESAQD